MLSERAKTSALPMYSKAVFEEELLLTFLAANLSFYLVEHLQFQRLIRITRPDVEFPTR
jgi:hypothetical protein